MKRSLPDEILLTIFEALTPSNLLQCQQVCRSWYPPAHIKLLKEITLTSSQSIEQFIASFDCNSSHSYFKAVKTIQLLGRRPRSDLAQTVLEKATIEKLFFRFPSLENVHVDRYSLITNFDEALCQALLLHCPNLKTFEADFDGETIDICTSLQKVAPLLTEMRLSNENYIADFVNPVRFVTQFQSLRSIFCEDESIESFDMILPILEQLSNVTSLHLAIGEDDDENFGENYLSTKPKELQDLLRTRLSNITDLSLNVYTIAKNAIKFVSEHFTGLKCFGMECNRLHWEPDENQDLFLANTFKLIPTVKGDYSVVIDFMNFVSLATNFTCLLQNMFDTVPLVNKMSNSRILIVTVRSLISGWSYVNLALESKMLPFSRKIKITADERFAVELSAGNAPMDHVDVFDLQFSDNDSYDAYINTEMYLNILGRMSSLKEVKLQVPATFSEAIYENNRPYNGPVLSQVEQATFTGTPNGTMQALLNSCYYAFPNLKLLNIFNFSGIWREHIGEFLLDLQDYSIDKLVLDTKPVVTKMNELKISYYVVEIEFRSSSERRFYKVSADHSSRGIIDFAKLRGSKCHTDYLRVRLTIDHLQQVELHVRGDMNAQSCVMMLDELGEVLNNK